MALNHPQYDQLVSEQPTIKVLAAGNGMTAFIGQEMLRFISIGGTLFGVNEFVLDETAVAEERYITHPLVRSLLEKFFWIVYICDEPADGQSRYDVMLRGFKKDYLKLLNEPLLPGKANLEAADPSWAGLTGTLDVNSMMAQVKDISGARLSRLYYVYRVGSFDTHGNSHAALLEDVFGKTCNMPVLKVAQALEMMAEGYLSVLAELRRLGLA
jgi:hypothetical protein